MDTGGLAYEERGEGEPVLLVPGTGFGARTWGAFGGLLATRRRVIAYDRRGFTAQARSQPRACVYMQRTLAWFWSKQEPSRPTWVGWSAGGLVALALAVEHPATCRSLLLIEPSLYGLRAVTLSALGMALRARAVRAMRGQRVAIDLAYRWTFAYRGRGRSAWEEMPGEWREQVLSHATAVAAEETHETSLRYPPRAALRAFDLPVMIVVGERSQPYFHRIASYVQRLVPGARLHSVGPRGIARRPPGRARHSPGHVGLMLAYLGFTQSRRGR
jgi:pimeloyl-ACP methyl ester carboxylesterase